MSAPAGTARHAGASLETRFLATARSEWIKFRSVRSGPAVLLSTAVILLGRRRADLQRLPRRLGDDVRRQPGLV